MTPLNYKSKQLSGAPLQKLNHKVTVAEALSYISFEFILQGLRDLVSRVELMVTWLAKC
jgi:hypothetical protein